MPVICATMMLAACSSDDSNNDPKPGPSPEPEEKSIFYTVTVGDDTRSTVNDNNEDIYFAEGDKLYISSDARTDLRGYLTLTSGVGTASASFSGKLYYTGDLPANDLSINGTLVGEDNVSLTTTGDKVTGTPNYGIGLVLPDGSSTAVNEAVKKYGYLKGTSTFGAKTFNTLTQQTTFLNFTINVKKSGVNVDDEYNVTVAGVGTDHSGTVKITASGSDKVLKFAVPISPQAIPNARVILYNNNVIPFGKATALNAKVYNVSREVNENYDYVDFGLSVKWAKTNLGAATETEYGNFYAWGGTIGYSSSVATDHTFDLAHAPYYNNSGSAYTKYTSGEVNLEAADDAATQSRGAGWRMPTKAEFENLLAATDLVADYDAGELKGYKLMKKGAPSIYIYLPAAGYRQNNEIVNQTGNFKSGYYWLSTLYSSDITGAYYIGFSYPYEAPQVKYLARRYGMTIRPVYVP